MPRKPKPPKKQTIQVIVNGKPVAITLHPPSGVRKSWIAYWTGLRGRPRHCQSSWTCIIAAEKSWSKVVAGEAEDSGCGALRPGVRGHPKGTLRKETRPGCSG